MKIFYSVQATGNGHVSRAVEVLPYLAEYGDVDIFLSGSNVDLKKELPTAYRSKGLSLVYNQSKGSIDIWQTIKNAQPKKIWKEAKYLPIENYDLIINDFECITSLSCKMKKIPSIHFGHQASFKSKLVPRPAKKDFMGEFVLSNYASAKKTIGLHFKKYDDFIFQPIIKQSILEADATDNGHITVYLSQYSPTHLIKIFKQLKRFTFHFFSKITDTPIQDENIKIFPIQQKLFNQSLISCHGIITGGGFETPAEALYLGKKLMVVPIAGQYEQQCNAAALKQDFNTTVIHEVDDFFPVYFNKWIFDSPTSKLILQESTQDIVSNLFSSLPNTTVHSKNVSNSPVILQPLLERIATL
ncbi:MAG: hypothetical protein RI965_1377 [Bacteroidota bacterium]|jgi:uncharacterized protein (TIGR00661 family)